MTTAATLKSVSSAAHAVRHGYAHLLSIRGASVKKKPEKRNSSVAERHTSPQFLHLLTGVMSRPSYEPPAIEAPKAPTPLTAGELAAAIIAAGERSRTRTGTGVAAPVGLAAKIIEAGRKRRALA